MCVPARVHSAECCQGDKDEDLNNHNQKSFNKAATLDNNFFAEVKKREIIVTPLIGATLFSFFLFFNVIIHHQLKLVEFESQLIDHLRSSS